LVSYSARLNNIPTPIDTFSGWTRPWGKQFLMQLNSKVQLASMLCLLMQRFNAPVISCDLFQTMTTASVVFQCIVKHCMAPCYVI
jgi:hypothetical protein